jgi:hypothetical protein
MADSCSDILDNTQVACVYLAAVLILVLLIFMQVRKMGYYHENFSDWQAGTPELVEFRTGHGYVRNVLPRVGLMGGSAVGLQTTTGTNEIPQAHGYVERS